MTWRLLAGLMPQPLPGQPRPARALFAMLQAVVRVGKCKLFGHAFENVIRVGRMVQPPILERRCRRCFVPPPLPRARVSR